MTWDSPPPFYAFCAVLDGCIECPSPDVYATRLCKRCYFRAYHRGR